MWNKVHLYLLLNNDGYVSNYGKYYESGLAMKIVTIKIM